MTADVPHALLQLALESADLGVWRLDLVNDVELLRSLRHDQMFGYRDLQPRWNLAVALEHIVEDDRPILARAFERARDEGCLACEFRVRWPDGSIHWIAPRGRTEYENGVARYVTGIISDVTARRRADEEDLQHNKLVAMGQLTAGIAHDFNNVLQGMGGAFDLIEQKANLSTVEGIAPIARLGAGLVERASRMTHRLLAFSRRSPLAPGPVNLNGRLPEIAALLRPTASQHVNVSVSVEGDLCALADDAQLETALLNLLVNARDASPRDGYISVSAASVNADGETPPSAHRLLCISVTDRGSGIAPDDLQRVFEPFFTTKSAGTGTGLGLSQVHGFAHQSGGRIEVESALNQGTTVRLYLPECGANENDAVPSTPGPVVPPPGVRILLVDDEPQVLAMLAAALREQGHEVITAIDAVSALRAWRAHAPLALLVTDIGLPGSMDGCELARWCRSEEPELPVILITGYAGETLKGRIPKAAQVLVKPFSTSTLGHAVTKAVGSLPRHLRCLPAASSKRKSL
ncbi:PAS domain-containing hybrid sensor histidine kinase/response regulator [Luteibacter yeojuensis]|uniref:histidine kinase n=1 Tax=Luteibacter yeojuensis TaxID=345309 RepID=A0A0F3KUC1_9GAMM|nr:PAS domain-containing hybrid sensor histidine kinase/response regulator [Luteibacter yeojuensis]KJV34761.1 hypothetical protein VI08_09230 [Luteibacter yeojuensis]